MEVSNSSVVRKGSWSEEEDRLLKRCIENYGEGKWHQVPFRAGLNRCRKSCRLRWLNYLKPNIKRGSFSGDEVDLMLRLHRLLGNRWSLIAGRLPGRTANDVKNYWNTNMQKKTTVPREARFKTQKKVTEVIKIIKPQPRTFSKDFPWLKNNTNTTADTTIPTRDNITHKPAVQGAQTTAQMNRNMEGIIHETTSSLNGGAQDPVPWWDDMVLDMGMDNGNNWLSFDESNFGDSITPPGIGAAEDNSSQWSQTGDWVDNFIEDNLEIWDLLGDQQVVV